MSENCKAPIISKTNTLVIFRIGGHNNYKLVHPEDHPYTKYVRELLEIRTKMKEGTVQSNSNSVYPVTSTFVDLVNYRRAFENEMHQFNKDEFDQNILRFTSGDSSVPNHYVSCGPRFRVVNSDVYRYLNDWIASPDLLEKTPQIEQKMEEGMDTYPLIRHFVELSEFFGVLDENRLDYVIYSGYEHLPKLAQNPIVIAVSSENEHKLLDLLCKNFDSHGDLYTTREEVDPSISPIGKFMLKHKVVSQSIIARRRPHITFYIPSVMDMQMINIDHLTNPVVFDPELADDVLCDQLRREHEL